MRETPRRTPIMRDGTISATRDNVDQSTVELTSRTQLRTDDAKLARETISLIHRDFCAFEDHAALVFEIFADDEIKIEVGHGNHLPSFQLYEN
jgi:hypothetical protein